MFVDFATISITATLESIPRLPFISINLSLSLAFSCVRIPKVYASGAIMFLLRFFAKIFSAFTLVFADKFVVLDLI